VAVAEFHAEAAFDDEKHFVFVVVMVEDERAVVFDQLDLLSVEFGGDMGSVVVVDLGELLGDVDFGHGSLRSGWLCLRFKFDRGSRKKQPPAFR
jgi:hypothetical protein